MCVCSCLRLFYTNNFNLHDCIFLHDTMIEFRGLRHSDLTTGYIMIPQIPISKRILLAIKKRLEFEFLG